MVTADPIPRAWPAPGVATITEPGAYPDVPDDYYHADPVVGGSLSVSGAKTLLRSPAHYRWQRQHPPVKRAFDFGHAAHKLALGVGPELVDVPFDDWKTKAARALGDEARARGAVPLLTAQLEQVRAMADALLADDNVGELFDPDTGQAEVSAFAPVTVPLEVDVEVMRRSRFDWLTYLPSGRLLIVDYKTTTDADPRKLPRTLYALGYHQQDAWYRDMAVDLDLDPDPEFLFVFQEKEPPYVVTPVYLDADAVATGRARNRAALGTYARCVRDDHWPGYTTGPVTLSLPRYAAYDD